MNAAFGTRIWRPRSPLSSTSRAVITLVTLAIGRSVSGSRAHKTWPVAASASTAPLALTPPGAPLTWITGLADGRGLDGVAGALVRAIADWLAAGRELPSPAAGAQAARPTAMTATAVSETTRTLSRMTPALVLSAALTMPSFPVHGTNTDCISAPPGSAR